jgi:hypothetical protein
MLVRMMRRGVGRLGRRTAVTALMAAALATTAAASPASDTNTTNKPAARSGVLRFDVAENPKKFVFAKDYLDADGLPGYGNYFVTQGYLYPEGTLKGNDGVKKDGSPLFPGKVLGEWTCYGVHIGNGAKTKTGPWVVTTQIFQLGKQYGRTTVLTDGYEVSDVGVPIIRAVTGGTGEYAGARGEQHQTLLGFGKTMGIKLRVRLALR